MITAVVFLFLATAVLGSNADSGPGGRIVGGKATNIIRYPYQVSVQRNGGHYCGGSVIDRYYVLTAAHCIKTTGKYNVRVGSSYPERGGVEYDIAQTIVHEKYRSLLTDYDVALFRLVTPLELSDVVQVVPLAELGEELAAGTPAVATGWGDLEEKGDAPTVLQEVEVPLIANDVCKKYYPLRITSRMICAGFQEGGRDACQGDSGGPLVAAGKQVGIVSWGKGCARSNAPGVYARVAALRDWIAQHSGV